MSPPTLDDLLHPGSAAVLLEAVAGSRAYGTATAASDTDLRGIFALPAAAYLALEEPPKLVQDARGNIVFFALRRVLELLAEGNPNVLELLYLPEDCIRRVHPALASLFDQRSLFLTRQCVEAHLGYAFSQIKKSRGQNKWINNPKPERAPAREDYCYVLPTEALRCLSGMPCRPRPLGELGWDLTEFHAARLEHARDAFRLYRYGAGARGVFRGDALALQSIPLDDEAPRFAGLLFYNEQAWRQASEDHRNYWTWRRERNEERWRQQERGELDYDAKNLMHTVRLLLSGKAIVEQGRPTVRFDGDELDTLRRIRAGAFRYDEVMDLAQGIVSDCRARLADAGLPAEVDRVAVGRLLVEITAEWESR